MDKKTTIQIIVALVFFSITFYVFKNLNSLSLANLGNGTGQKVASNAENSQIEALLQRNFRTEQSLILGDPKFLGLQPSLTFDPDIKEMKAGKKNPFEEKAAEAKKSEKLIIKASTTIESGLDDLTNGSSALEENTAPVE